MLGLIASALFYLVKRTITLYTKVKRAEYEVYIDTSGIAENPPKFVELMEGKTINIRLETEYLCINQVSFNKGLGVIDKIVYLFNILVKQMSKQSETRTEELKGSVLKMQTYNAIVNQIYLLGKPFAKNKRRFKKELFKKSKDDFQFLLTICQEVIDFWSHVGKQAALLSKGKTLRETYGENVTASLLSTGLDGKIEIKPRYAYSTN